MKNYGLGSVHDFVGDFIVYRALVPADPRLPRPAGGAVPRKSQPAYGRAIAHLLQAARALDRPEVRLERLLYVGDTRLNDGTAFANICGAGGWPGAAFIGAEDAGAPPRVEVAPGPGGPLYLANRWAALAGFEDFCREQGLPIDEVTAVVVDLDKTALGARGRNDHVIDGVRVEAVRRTVGGLLGDAWDPEAFRQAYDLFNRPEFHPFTADNQDYLAYVCLILGSGLYAPEQLAARVRAGDLDDFAQFIAEVDERALQLSVDLRAIHARIYTRVQQGDPTPFKAFRRKEYRATVERMGCLDDDALAANELLAGEIVVTHEVRAAALTWKARGALLFGLSDKPDEASVPPAELVGQGYAPIHRTQTHVVGA